MIKETLVSYCNWLSLVTSKKKHEHLPPLCFSFSLVYFHPFILSQTFLDM